jgi:hypothetical protein
MNLERHKMATNKLQHRSFVLLVSLFTMAAGSINANGQWSVSSSLQYSTGNYIYEQNTSTFYLYGGLRYRGNRWQVSASLPLISQNSDLVTGSGGAFFPSTHHGNNESGGTHHRGGMGSTGTSEMINGVGDMYLYGSWELLGGGGDQPTISINPRIKVPTASTEKGFGSGKWDYGISATVRKRLGQYFLLGDVGFWMLGDPDSLNYRNPLVAGVGVGRFLNHNQTGLMLYYETYSTIVSGLDPLRQLSLGLSHRLREGVMLNIIGAAGLSESTPDLSLSGGVEWQF